MLVLFFLLDNAFSQCYRMHPIPLVYAGPPPVSVYVEKKQITQQSITTVVLFAVLLKSQQYRMPSPLLVYEVEIGDSTFSLKFISLFYIQSIVQILLLQI